MPRRLAHIEHYHNRRLIGVMYEELSRILTDVIYAHGLLPPGAMLTSLEWNPYFEGYYMTFDCPGEKTPYQPGEPKDA